MSSYPYLVVGGELCDITAIQPPFYFKKQTFQVVGVYNTLVEVQSAWRSKAQQTVDNALMRFIIITLDEVMLYDDSNTK